VASAFASLPGSSGSSTAAVMSAAVFITTNPTHGIVAAGEVHGMVDEGSHCCSFWLTERMRSSVHVVARRLEPGQIVLRVVVLQRS
jgi:hypothetical protein